MKKTILLASVIASMTALAVESPKGFVEGTAKGEVTFKQNVSNETKISGDVEELSVKGEVKVNRFTLGAVLANKDLKGISKENPITTEKYTDNLLDHSSVYAKYELPEFSGIKSYVKGTLNPKAPTEDGKHNFKKGNVELEGQLAHSFNNGVEVSLTSKTKFPFEKKDGEYGKGVESEHVLKVAAKKLNKFEDLEASLKLNHTYAKEEAFKFVDLSAKGTYAGIKDTKLTGKANFRYQVNGTSDVKDLLTDGQIKLNKDAYAHSYELDGKYTGVKDLELTAGAFVQHVHYANAELGDYAANPFELLYAKSLISKDKDFFKHYSEILKVQKEAFEKAQKTLKNATEADKTAYENAVKEYNQLVADVKASLESDVTTTKTAYDGVAAANKETAKKAYDKQVEINGYEKELADLNAKHANLVNFIIKYNDASKEEFRNTDTQTAELQKITDKINALEAKKDAATAELDNINGAGNAEGKKYAKAQYDKDSFNEESFRSDQQINPPKYKKDSNNKYKVSDEDGARTAKEFYDEITRTPYGKALALVNKYNDFDFAKKGYEETIKGAKGVTAKLDLVNFGAKLGAKYTGVKNLTLTVDGVFAGRYHSGYNQLFKLPAYTTGYVKLHAGAKYDFKLLNDKLFVSPEGNVTTTFADIYAGICNPSLVLAPKVSVEYKPIEELKVKGSVEVPVRFGLNELNEFRYKNTGIKGSLNMRYEWK